MTTPANTNVSVNKMRQSATSATNTLSKALSKAQRQDVSIDPIVAQVHAVRQAQWEQCGGDMNIWFKSVLASQAQFMTKP
jgi:hypothetical protein